jgi:AcrR family transcriptional regulator
VSTANPRGRPRAFDRTTALEQAMDLFWRHGYEGVSLADLTAAMGIRPPSLYATFGSKAALFKEAVAHYNEVEGAGPQRALWDAPTARAGVAALLRHHARAYVDPARPTGCMVALSATTIGADHDDLHGFVAECRRADVADLARRVERGIADGDVPADAVPAAVAEYVYAVSLGMAVRARDGAGGECAAEHHDDLGRHGDAGRLGQHQHQHRPVAVLRNEALHHPAPVAENPAWPATSTAGPGASAARWRPPAGRLAGP